MLNLMFNFEFSFPQESNLRSTSSCRSCVILSCCTSEPEDRKINLGKMLRPTYCRYFQSLSVISVSANSASTRQGCCALYRKSRNMSSSKGLPKVFITRRIPVDGINLLRNKCEVTQWDSDDAIPRSELMKGIKGVDALFCLLTDKIDDEILAYAGMDT